MKRKEDATQAAKHLGHGEVNSFSKLYTLTNFTDDPAIISKHVYSMLKSFRIPCADIRGLGIQITRLDNQETISCKQFNVLDAQVYFLMLKIIHFDSRSGEIELQIKSCAKR